LQGLTYFSANALAINQACSKKKHIGNLMGTWHLIRPYRIIYMTKKNLCTLAAVALATLGLAPGAMASESNIVIPDLTQVHFPGLGNISGPTLMYIGLAICVVGALFGLLQYTL
jgi:hypothetical protein